MKSVIIKYTVLLILLFLTQNSFSQIPIESGDPPNNTDIPGFYKSRLSDIEAEIAGMKIGKVKIIATSPGDLPVYAVYYGEKDDLKSHANYNSALGAGNPAYYARKGKDTKPVVYFIGPVHGQEAEGIVGLVNLLHVAETGKDHRGKEWLELKEYINRCRVIIIPCGNPDGRRRCPYDSFVGLPIEIMTKYGQGTKMDGSSWTWAPSKSVHPMKGDVGILGAYFNDDGINIMHDNFFSPMSETTKAILKIANDEAPDISVALHSAGCCVPFIAQSSLVPVFIKGRIVALSNQLKERYISLGLPHQNWELDVTGAETEPPPKISFNLISALHYASGTMSFTFESLHGTLTEVKEEPLVTYNKILDVQLVLYQEMFDYIINHRLYWE